MIPLFTSIPPHIVRKNSDGQDIGHQYALKCVQSWRNNGFDPITINAEGESLSEIIAAGNIKRIAVKRDAGQQVGKPLVFLGDFIQSACNCGRGGPVVITNADILVDIPAIAYRQLESLQPGQCFVAKRYDVLNMDSRYGPEYFHGYDFFAFHTEDLKSFVCDDFIIGMPWWDHYLPVWMYLMGLQQLPINDPFAFHLVHTERWEYERWITFGKKFLNLVRNISVSDVAASALVDNYSIMINCELKERNSGFKNRLWESLRGLSESGRAKNEIMTLHRVADANIRWLDDIRSTANMILQ